MNLSEIVKPSWLINTETVKQNIESMKQKAKLHNLSLRPHFKTHQSTEIGKLFMNAGINKITVSSMDMANKFINEGFKDICLAIPFNIRETKRLNTIPQDVIFHVCVESAEVVKYLQKNLSRDIGIYIKTDCGYHRSGINYTETKDFQSIIEIIAVSDKMQFTGLLTHSGHTYNAESKKEIIDINDNVKAKLIQLKNSLGTEMILSIGDTPSMSICDNFHGIQEVRPGNFVYYDLMQYYLGACKINQIAGRVFAPVVGKNKIRNEIIVHAGGVHISKEYLFTSNGEKNFGEAYAIHSKNQKIILKDRPKLTKLSQEHGTLSVDQETFHAYKHGDLVEILPIHSCLSANLLKQDTHLI